MTVTLALSAQRTLKFAEIAEKRVTTPLYACCEHLDYVETQQEAIEAAFLGPIKTSGAGAWEATFKASQ